jgi:hypothetical protein
MFPSEAFFVQPEIEYKRTRARRALAASRRGRTRSSWLRRLDAADKPVR